MRVTFFDLEATALNGNWGRILAASFKDLGDDEVQTFRRDVAPWRGRNRVGDERLAKAIRNRLEAADIIVSWYGTQFDVPMLNTRLVAARERILQDNEKHGLTHIDLLYYARGRGLKIGSSKLEKVGEFFGLEKKTPLDGETWQLAAAGDETAMDQVVDHCEADVRITHDLWQYLYPYIKKHQFPIGELGDPEILLQIPSRKR